MPGALGFLTQLERSHHVILSESAYHAHGVARVEHVQPLNPQAFGELDGDPYSWSRDRSGSVE
eukprot:5657450-Lingulodinium_polyedra.AAC.1